MQTLRQRRYLVLLAGMLSALSAWSAVDVEFIQPDGFSDINNNGSFGTLRPAEVLDILSRQMVKLGQGCIAPEQTLAIQVSDVRLAGRLGVESGLWCAPDVRIMREVDWPSITLSWQRTGADGTVLGAGKETLSDMDYLHHAISVNDDITTLPYERNMLAHWFDRRFCAPAAARP